MIFIDQNDILGPFDRLSYAVDLCVLPWDCVSGNLLVFLGSFSGDVQCSEHYSVSDGRKLEMCAKFHFHTSTNMEEMQGRGGVGRGGGNSHPPDLYMSPVP